jgi:hypothetical protein
MEGFGMLDNEDKINIKQIEEIAKQIWDDECQFGNVDVKDAPFGMFEMQLMIYNFDILLTYDRSILGINIKASGEYISIRKLTDKEIIGGFDSCRPENLLYNFRILDEMLRSMRTN